jgi:hypothetical protein
MASPTPDSFSARKIQISPKDEERPSDSTSDTSQLAEKGLERVADATPPPEEEEEYVTGVKLALVLTSITVVYFLMLVDNTIIATVSWRSATPDSSVILNRPS